MTSRCPTSGAGGQFGAADPPAWPGVAVPDFTTQAGAEDRGAAGFFGWARSSARQPVCPVMTPPQINALPSKLNCVPAGGVACRASPTWEASPASAPSSFQDTARSGTSNRNAARPEASPLAKVRRGSSASPPFLVWAASVEDEAEGPSRRAVAGSCASPSRASAAGARPRAPSASADTPPASKAERPRWRRESECDLLVMTRPMPRPRRRPASMLAHVPSPRHGPNSAVSGSGGVTSGHRSGRCWPSAGRVEDRDRAASPGRSDPNGTPGCDRR